MGVQLNYTSVSMPLSIFPSHLNPGIFKLPLYASSSTVLSSNKKKSGYTVVIFFNLSITSWVLEIKINSNM